MLFEKMERAILIGLIVPGWAFCAEIARLRLNPIDFENAVGTSPIYLKGIGQIESGEGRLYFRHSQDPQILVTDLNGRVLRVIGALGEGPGEFRPGVSAIAARGDQLWAVNSAASRKLSLFSEGTFVRSFQISSINVRPYAHNSNVFAFNEKYLVFPCYPRTGFLAYAYDEDGEKKGVGSIVFDKEDAELLHRNPAMNDTNWLYRDGAWYCLFKYHPLFLQFDEDFEPVNGRTLESPIIQQKATEIIEFEPQDPSHVPVPLFSDVKIMGDFLFVMCHGYLHQFRLESGALIAIYQFQGEGPDFPSEVGRPNMHFFTIIPQGRVFLGNKGLPWGHDFWYADLPSWPKTRP